MGISVSSLGPDAQRQVREKLTLELHRCPKCNSVIGIRGCDCGYCSAEPGYAKRAKYGNKRTPHKSTQGFERTYDSKREAAHAAYLDQAIAGKRVMWWLPQVPLPLPGGVVYRADFLVCWGNGESGGDVEVQDVKGKDTQASINKRKQVKACYGIDVAVIR